MLSTMFLKYNSWCDGWYGDTFVTLISHAPIIYVFFVSFPVCFSFWPYWAKSCTNSITTNKNLNFETFIWQAFFRHSSWQWLFEPKKSSSKSTNIGPTVHIVATWETIKKLKNNTPFEGPVVLRLKYPAIWADWAEHGNCYLLKECCFLISL